MLYINLHLKEVKMILISKLRLVKSGDLIFSIFYTIVGATEIFMLFLTGFRLFPLGFLGLLSFTSAYGLITMKKWSVWLAVIRLSLGTTFGVTVLYASVRIQTFYPSLGVLTLHFMLTAYIVITVIASIYVLARINELK